MTNSGGEALPSTLLVPLPGGPFPRPPRQQHSKERRNPPFPLDFLDPMGVEPDTGVPSPSLCCPAGDDPRTSIPHQH
ncbi:Endoglycoceramidase [Operophtera brumata]|uniref:Endoglycoceramidase n=1 Tax=Operophtera brumata TaxID=104452 RepID=A0A0L7LEC2_OPEBR|nr:Endoglycoceramidase [Operophtera brumata]